MYNFKAFYVKTTICQTEIKADNPEKALKIAQRLPFDCFIEIDGSYALKGPKLKKENENE